MKLPLFLTREKWALVKTLSYNGNINIRNRSVAYIFYFHLHESNKGNRRVELGSTNSLISSQLQYIANQIPMYHEKVMRWIEGRYDPDILGYNEISEEDVVNALRGKI